MSFHDLTAPASRKNRAPSAPGLLAAPGLMVQRKCACGTHTADGECEDCKRKQRGVLQRRDRGQADPVLRLVAPGAGAGAGRSTFAHDFSGLTTSNPRAAQGVPALRTAPRIQGQPLPGASQEMPTASPTPAVTQAPGFTPAPAATPESTPEPSPEAAPESTPEAATEAPVAATPGRLIADDGATDLQPGQLRKSEFLDQLQTAVCAEAEAALAGTEQSTTGCPYLAFWFDYYRDRSSEQVESALRRYAPEARNARTASEYIPIVAARVRQGVERWASTGEVTGVPEGVPLGLPGGLGGLASGIGSLLFKAREGGARAAGDPAAVQAELGSGRPLESGVRSRMESAFGRSFSHVRTHTDATGSRLSSEQNARAFTVGEHVAFAPSEYRPGTLVGDALIAHELAHVVQQGGGSEAPQAKSTDSATYGALERDADVAAVGAVASLWGAAKTTIFEAMRNASPRVRSGLRIQRCGGDTKKEEKKTNLTSLCDDASCLGRSGCKVDECKEEAKTVTDTYVKRVKAIRRPDMPNIGDVHWGWMCYQWAGLLMREFEKLSPKCWQIRWVGIVSSSGSLEHNYVFTSLGPAKSDKGPVRDCGLILDPWRTGNPVVYGGEWDWHKWNYIHDTKDNTGQVYRNGRWEDVTYPPPWTPPEPTPNRP